MTNAVPTYEEFVALVDRMRTAQCRYFRDRNPNTLAECKVLERKVDRAVAAYRGQPDLFDGLEG